MFRFIKKTAGKAGNAAFSRTHKLLNVQEIRENAESTRGIAKEFWASRKGTGRRETFASAVTRRGLTQADLAALYRQHSLIAYVTLVLSLSAIGMAVMNVSGSDAASLGGFLAGFGAFMALAGFFFRASFRAFQIHRRELCSVSVWCRNPWQWLPAWSLDLSTGQSKGVRRV